MTYFYKVKETITRKIGGTPPAKEYVSIDSNRTVRHIKDGEILEETKMAYPIDIITSKNSKDLMELYEDTEMKRLARSMLIPEYRKKKIMKPKSIRKVKIDKKCKCK